MAINFKYFLNSEYFIAFVSIYLKMIMVSLSCNGHLEDLATSLKIITLRLGCT